MKHLIKHKLKSIYQSIIDHFTWLFVDESQKKQWFESDEEQEEQELRGFVPDAVTETDFKLEVGDVLKTNISGHNLTEKQTWMLNYVCSFDDYVSPTKVGRNWGVAVGKNHACGSQHASKTLIALVEKGLLKNEKGKYKKA